MIAVVDYGVNNLRSVVRALAAGGHAATLTDDPDLVRQADRVLLPGVGNFGRASLTLRETGLGQALTEVVRAGRPVLGICLGLQLFFSRSEEAPGAEGLGLLVGTVAKFTTSLPVPHVGWAAVQVTHQGGGHPAVGPLFASGEQFFYHVHSYHPAGLSAASVLATGEYGETFPTIVGRDNLLGVQFHPEKSQRIGIALLSGFINWRP